MQKQIVSKNNKSKGIALLFTVLMTSGLLLVALGITNVAYRQAAFSVEAFDSSWAFFAADAGMECARVYDKVNAFVSSPPTGLRCLGGNVPTTVTVLGSNLYRIDGIHATACWRAIINTNFDPDGTGPLPGGQTQINSYGYTKYFVSTVNNYNTCSPDYNNPRLVVRGTSTFYP